MPPTIQRPLRIARSWIVPVTLLVGCSSGPPPYHLQTKYSVGDPEFVQTIGNLLGPPLVAGNATTTLVNGQNIFPPMLDAIRSAHRTINMETYVYWKGFVGEAFSKALAERAANGVNVHLIIDAVGSSDIDPHYIKTMEDAGVQIATFNPLKWYDWTTAAKINHRTHRKLLVIDGQIGFTGGAGIADEWLGNADSPEHYRDDHYLVRGPLVLQLQSAFCDNWIKTTGVVLHGAEYFPRLEPVGPELGQVFRTSPTGDNANMELMYQLSIAAARKTIRIATAYFIPDQQTIDLLIDARKRGVKIQFIVPGQWIDEPVVRPASRSLWGPLLQAGIEIYEYQPTMYHCKQMVVDDLWVSLGSANFDNRSFRLNDETNLNILDARFASEQSMIFDQDLAKSKRITYDQWKRRPLHEKIADLLASIFNSLL